MRHATSPIHSDLTQVFSKQVLFRCFSAKKARSRRTKSGSTLQICIDVYPFFHDRADNNWSLSPKFLRAAPALDAHQSPSHHFDSRVGPGFFFGESARRIAMTNFPTRRFALAKARYAWTKWIDGTSSCRGELNLQHHEPSWASVDSIVRLKSRTCPRFFIGTSRD